MVQQAQKEIRKILVDTVETRSTEDGSKVIEGYIAKFNVKSQFMGFYEQISPKAFDKTLADGHNIFAMYNHREGGRTVGAGVVAKITK